VNARPRKRCGFRGRRAFPGADAVAHHARSIRHRREDAVGTVRLADLSNPFLASEHYAFLRREYDAHFGGVSERQRAGHVQVWP
jgi:hypothetical protein